MDVTDEMIALLVDMDQPGWKTCVDTIANTNISSMRMNTLLTGSESVAMNELQAQQIKMDSLISNCNQKLTKLDATASKVYIEIDSFINQLFGEVTKLRQSLANTVNNIVNDKKKEILDSLKLLEALRTNLNMTEIGATTTMESYCLQLELLAANRDSSLTSTALKEREIRVATQIHECLDNLKKDLEKSVVPIDIVGENVSNNLSNDISFAPNSKEAVKLETNIAKYSNIFKTLCKN